MVRFLDKNEEMGLLPELFDLLYRNMEQITPFAQPYETEKRQWVRCLEEALQKPPRQMVLLYHNCKLAGFCMFYINGGVLMMEEVQIQREFQRSTLVVELYRFLKGILPGDTVYVEAYADKRNLNSRRMMEKHGMEPVAGTQDADFIRYRGTVSSIFK